MPARAGALTRRCLVVPAALVAGWLIVASPAPAAVVFDGGPGSGAAPDSLGPYAVNPYPADTRPSDVVHTAPAPSASLGFSRPMSLRRISDASWSSGAWAGGTFAGAVYWNLGAGATTITLPEPQRAFYLYGQADFFGTYAMTATAQDGTTSGEIQATTGAVGINARFFGFYGTGDDLISSVTISSPEADEDFAVGNFGGGNAGNGPSVGPIAGNATLVEGATGSYGVTATDADGGPLAYEWSVTSGPGSITSSAGGAAADVRVDDGPAAIGLQVIVTGAAGQAVTRRFVVHASNLPATARLAERNDRQVAEGQSRTYAYAIEDPGNDTIDRVETSCGDGGRRVEGSESDGAIAGSFECRFPDGPAGPAVSVVVTDSDGEAGAQDVQSVTVDDIAPVLTFAAADGHVDEGSTRLYPYTISDPGEDAQSVAADCGDAGEKVPGSERNTDASGSFECRFPDGHTGATIHAAPTDSDRVAGDDETQAIAIENVPPAVAIVGGAERIVDAAAAHLVEYSIDDPGQDTPVEVQTGCGRDATKVAGSDRHGDSAGSFRCFMVDGSTSSTVSVRATDSDGDSGAADMQELTVAGGGPLAKLSPSNMTSVDESRTERSFAYAISVPAHEAIAAIDTTCGARGEKVHGSDSRSSRSGRFRCVFPLGPASSAVSVSVTVRGTAHRSTSDTQDVTITDPRVTAAGRRFTGVENAPIAGRTVARFTDPTPYARAAEYDATIDWGDGSAPTNGSIAKTGGGSFAVRGTHTYRRFGVYVVTVAIGDVDNSANAAVATSRAAIADAAIHVRDGAVTTLPDFAGAMATFRDDGDGPRSDFSGSIAWGDGGRSAAMITRTADGTFVVSGSHAYGRSGRYDASVRVESVGGSDDRTQTDVLVYAFASSDGATFAVGDAAATPGAPVTFWGSRWSRQNALRSGAAVDASFKGFVKAQAGRASPRCGDGWTSPASAGPPADVPAFMGVVVVGAVAKSGSTVAGDVRKVVVVRTDGGYRPDPARAGTGVVVSTVCG
ncbi:MAG TPA: hypothetical protein VGO80_16935 [Solirubrobacteraceae bacterium]|jgi:hypothetical protein|nr:hypothetical protein [Solirubrobacteraceae bacterium]